MRYVILTTIALLLLGVMPTNQAEASDIYSVIGFDRWGQFEAFDQGSPFIKTRILRAKRLNMESVVTGGECLASGSTQLDPRVNLRSYGVARLLFVKDVFNNNTPIVTETTIYADETGIGNPAPFDALTDRRMWTVSADTTFSSTPLLNEGCYATSGDLAYWEFKVSLFENGPNFFNNGRNLW